MGDYWTNKYALVRASWQLAEEHNTQMAACGARVATLESRLARIAALVKPVPVADLVEAGIEAPALLAERHRHIRAILEEEG